MTANDLTYASTPSQPRGFDILGNLNADLTFAMHVADLITIGGDLNGDITIVNDLWAEIDVAGHINGAVMIERDLWAGSATRGAIITAGDLNGSIVVKDDMLATANQQESLISIGGDLNSLIQVGDEFQSATARFARITVGDDLNGQVVLNANNGSGTWSGVVSVGGNAITTGPYYTNTGFVGAVGLCRYRLHDLECIPVNGGQSSVGAFTVTLKFYGPVKSSSSLPFNIWWRPSGSSGSWTLDNAFWQVEAGLGTRTVTLLYTDESDPSIIPYDREYWIEPILTGTEKLLCDNLLTTSDVPVADFDFLFDSH